MQAPAGDAARARATPPTTAPGTTPPTDPDTTPPTDPDAAPPTDPDTIALTDPDPGPGTAADAAPPTAADAAPGVGQSSAPGTVSGAAPSTDPDTGAGTAPDAGQSTAPDAVSGTAPDVGQSSAPDAAPDATAPAAPGTVPDPVSGSASDAAPPLDPDAGPGTVLDVTAPAASGTAPDTASGTAPDAASGPASDAAPPLDPDAGPGTAPDAGLVAVAKSGGRCPVRPAPAIRTRGLVKSYPGPDGSTTDAVRGLDLEVFQGETYAFLGPNGAGKSTTLALLCALARPTAGQAMVAGADVQERPDQVRRRVGMLFQHSALDPDLTAEQNLHIHARLYGLRRRYARLRVTEMLETVALADRRRSLVRTLSGGMRRRLELARGLLHAPQVLFLDEPTTGLDPHARAQVWQHLRTLCDRHGSTLFITTHYLEEAEHCDRLGILDQGRLVAEGTPHALKAEIGEDRVVLHTGDDAAARQVVSQAVSQAADRTADRTAVGGAAGRAGPPGPAVTLEAGGLSLRLPDGSAWIPRLCAALADRGIAVHAASATPPTLDDVFFHHTGRSIHAPRSHPAPGTTIPAATQEAP
ncbi:ATP-binding cassette domain-containing protein [Streptomyces collinus]|uniref:ABC transporter ATP-binding protein n=1 Tax=Streptomyces collinus TaxID=42684 RepID=UPI003F564D33